LRVEGVTWSAKLICTTVNLGLLDRSHCILFFQIAPQLSSRGWMDHGSDPLLLKNYSGRTTSNYSSRNHKENKDLLFWNLMSWYPMHLQDWVMLATKQTSSKSNGFLQEICRTSSRLHVATFYSLSVPQWKLYIFFFYGTKLRWIHMMWEKEWLKKDTKLIKLLQRR
jgi:hypothetical protein